MSPAEAAALLGVCALYDNRQADDDGDTARAWALALDGLTFDDCRQAVVSHYTTKRDWIMPSDIRDYVKAIRNERLRAAGDITDRIPVAIAEIEDENEHTQATLDWLRNAKRRIADGEPVDIVAPRLQLVPSDAAKVAAITEGLAKKMRAPGTRERGETA